jgi:competence ComEA-like helix-hairpin-helix protein
MRHRRDLLLIFLLSGLPWFTWPRPPPAIGASVERLVCPVVVEAAGVGCLSQEEAQRARLRSGDRLTVGGDGRIERGRMAPVRLAALELPVDLNRASLDELASLDGVGPKLAERIWAARPFVTVDELLRVKGLGKSRIERLRRRLTVRLDD